MHMIKAIGSALPCLLAAFALTLAPSAYALKSDASQPIEISADHWEHSGDASGNNGTSIYTGNVIITQGSIRITADEATLTLAGGKLTKAVIVGSPATFRQVPERGQEPVHGRALRINYNAPADTVELFDQARVHQAGKLITANYIRYDISAEKVVARQSKQRKQRVHVVIPPHDSGDGTG